MSSLARFLVPARRALTFSLQQNSSGSFVVAAFSSRSSGGGGRRRRPPLQGSGLARRDGPPPPAVDPADAWEAVTDKASGQVYYWNRATNETTALGAPKPSALGQPVQQQAAAPSLMGMVVEGFAFGTGASLARHAVGSFFGGGGGDGGGGISGGGDGDDGGGDWDI